MGPVVVVGCGGTVDCMTELSDWTYVVTDIEVDGPWAGPKSMRSIASVAATMDGRTFGVKAIKQDGGA
jgi:nitrogenase subunit NifH